MSVEPSGCGDVEIAADVVAVKFEHSYPVVGRGTTHWCLSIRSDRRMAVRAGEVVDLHFSVASIPVVVRLPLSTDHWCSIEQGDLVCFLACGDDLVFKRCIVSENDVVATPPLTCLGCLDAMSAFVGVLDSYDDWCGGLR
jgi:hypothetical protein